MYLLDTNHCSALIFGDPRVIARANAVGEFNLAISVITEVELLYMAEHSEQIEENLIVVEEFVEDIAIYDVDEHVSRVYAKLKARLMLKFAPKDKNKRRKTRITDLGVSENDLWIAATAIENNLIMVSADRDFQRIQQIWNFPLENWSNLLETS